jgi:hypothetical protein
MSDSPVIRSNGQRATNVVEMPEEIKTCKPFARRVAARNMTEKEFVDILVLETGHVAMFPSHKVLFGSSGDLPDYKKLHATCK